LTPDRRPIVLLHGLAVSHRYLLPLARVLAPRHRVLVPDLLGFGFSSKPARALDVGEHAERVAAWLTGLRVPPACVLGHSFGAEVAAAVAASHPEPLCALVLAGPTSDPAARTRRGLILRWLRDLPREAAWQVPILARDIHAAGVRRVLRTVGHSVGNAIEDDVARVRVPVLVVRGERDPIAPAGWARQLGATVTVAGAAHNVVATAPRAVAAAVERLLSTALGR
jgi:pimeloyl-ACP methyl ester carboxylesterase